MMLQDIMSEIVVQTTNMQCGIVVDHYSVSVENKLLMPQSETEHIAVSAQNYFHMQWLYY